MDVPLLDLMQDDGRDGRKGTGIPASIEIHG